MKQGDRGRLQPALDLGEVIFTHPGQTGHEGGAKVIAVASGKTSEDQLRNAGAEVSLPDLTDTEALTAALGLTP